MHTNGDDWMTLRHINTGELKIIMYGKENWRILCIE